MLPLGAKIQVRIHRLRDARIFRFPVQVHSSSILPAPSLATSSPGLRAAPLQAACFVCPAWQAAQPSPPTPPPAPPSPLLALKVAAVSAALAEVVVDPEAHEAPMDLRDMSM